MTAGLGRTATDSVAAGSDFRHELAPPRTRPTKTIHANLLPSVRFHLLVRAELSSALIHIQIAFRYSPRLGYIASFEFIRTTSWRPGGSSSLLRFRGNARQHKPRAYTWLLCSQPTEPAP